MDKIETTPVGSRRHSYVGRKGDLRVELHYADPHKHCGREACLYVYRAVAPTRGVLLPFCQMWQFDTRQFGFLSRQAKLDEARTVQAAVRIANQLYGFATQSDWMRVLDVMCDYMQDLKDHKPETGLDQTMDEWLAALDAEGLEFFMEVNGTRVV